MLESLDAQQRGLTDAPELHRWNRADARAGDGDAGEQMTLVVSNGEVDRREDVISADGCRLDSYERNPVFLLDHAYTRPVFGRALSVSKEPQHLLARMEFAPTDFAREAAKLYRSGYQRGVLVGFEPGRYEERRDEKPGPCLAFVSWSRSCWKSARYPCQPTAAHCVVSWYLGTENLETISARTGHGAADPHGVRVGGGNSLDEDSMIAVFAEVRSSLVRYKELFDHQPHTQFFTTPLLL